MSATLFMLGLAVVLLGRAVYCLRRDLESLAAALGVEPFRTLEPKR